MGGQFLDLSEFDVAVLAAITYQQPFFPTFYGTEFTSKAILKWANDTGVEWHYIDPGKPQQNGYIESFNAACATNA